MATKPASVTEKTFDTDVLKAGTPVLVDFWATWCGPCKMIAPIVEEIAGEYEGKLRVMKLDVDENSGIAARYSIMSIPTLGIFRSGELVERIVGYMPKEALKKRIDAALS
ncbi:MAG TPA: thioredoxin [bacterium]|nr:thioredoxin [bacterium]HYM71088.1 thioredoxin [bacterium]